MRSKVWSSATDGSGSSHVPSPQGGWNSRAIVVVGAGVTGAAGSPGSGAVVVAADDVVLA